MVLVSPERKIRAGLPIIRLMQAYLPLPIVRWTERYSATHVRLPADIAWQVVNADGVRCEWFIPQNVSSGRVLLYLHGGGFIFGVSSPHRNMVAYLARKMGVRALMVDYRLAPEHPFPAALEDCVNAYRWLLKQGISAGQIVMAGDSAGGHLTLTTLMQLRDTQTPLPVAAACLSPVVDLSERGDLFQKMDDPLLHPKAAIKYRESYVVDNDPRNPLISPAYGNWHGLPPILIHCGEDEVLREDSILAATALKAAGGEVRLRVFPRMWHVWQIFLELPQSLESLDEIVAFLQSRHAPAFSESELVLS